MTTTDTLPTPGRRRPALDRATAMQLAEVEYQRYLAQLQSLGPEDWARPTACPAWDVRQMATHCLGMAEMAATTWEMVRQNAKAARRPEEGVDALTALQVEERAAMQPDAIIAHYAAVGPNATAGRRRRSRLMGWMPFPEAQVVNGVAETWTFGFLLDTILTRDTWMHRVDTARATDREMALSAEHDGRLVADVVQEWATRHDAPYELRLTGPAGGTWSRGAGGEHIEIDAVEFCRTLSGRASGEGLLAVEVPF